MRKKKKKKKNLICVLKLNEGLQAGTHQADGRPLANVGPTASDGQASLFGVFHSSALVGLTSVAVCPIQHVELASGTSVKGRTLIGCSV